MKRNAASYLVDLARGRGSGKVGGVTVRNGLPQSMALGYPFPQGLVSRLRAHLQPGAFCGKKEFGKDRTFNNNRHFIRQPRL